MRRAPYQCLAEAIGPSDLDGVKIVPTHKHRNVERTGFRLLTSPLPKPVRGTVRVAATRHDSGNDQMMGPTSSWRIKICGCRLDQCDGQWKGETWQQVGGSETKEDS